MPPSNETTREEPIRVKLHTSLVQRPLVAGVDLEFMLLAGFLLWTAFLVFKLTLPFWVVLATCGALWLGMSRANARDPFFLPILIRSLLFRKAYAARSGPTDVAPVRPSIPPRALPS